MSDAAKASLSLPSDIWHLIATHLSPHDLPRHASLNSAFFQTAMDQKYRQVSFAYLGDKMMRLLGRLRDPFVARRVRTLFMHPHFLKEALERDDAGSICHGRDNQRPEDDIITVDDNHHRYRILSIAPRSKKKRPPNLRALRWPWTAPPVTPAPTSPVQFDTTEELIQLMLSVLNGLTNLVEYHVSWSGLPELSRASPVNLLLVPLRPMLRRLSLDTSVERAACLMCASNLSQHSLARLEELDLFIRREKSLILEKEEDLDRRRAASLRHLGILVGTHARSLKSLSIRICEHVLAYDRDRNDLQTLDLSPFFATLASRPLESLERLAFEAPPISGALPAFLNAHGGSLKSLAIRGSYAKMPGARLSESTIEGIEDLPHLMSLELGLALLPFTLALSCIRRFASTLQRVVVAGAYLPFDRACAVLRTVRLGRRLKVLRLGTVTLSPQLVDEMERCTETVERVELIVRDVVPWEIDEPMFIPSFSLFEPSSPIWTSQGEERVTTRMRNNSVTTESTSLSSPISLGWSASSTFTHESAGSGLGLGQTDGSTTSLEDFLPPSKSYSSSTVDISLGTDLDLEEEREMQESSQVDAFLDVIRRSRYARWRVKEISFHFTRGRERMWYGDRKEMERVWEGAWRAAIPGLRRVVT